MINLVENQKAMPFVETDCPFRAESKNYDKTKNKLSNYPVE